MKAIVWSSLTICASLTTAVWAGAQPPMGALAIDERQGDEWGWAVDYETAAAARRTALRECGPGCSVVLTFGRCAAYAADQDADSSAVGWAESYASADGARRAALTACGSRGGSRCIVRVWGCNGTVVEENLGLDRAAWQQIQEGLEATGFDPGGADGLSGPRTRRAIRRWQASRGARATGYLDDASVEALRSPGAPRQAGPATAPPPPVAATGQQASPALFPATAQPPVSPPATAEQENLFWQSIMNSTNPAEFEAYLAQFPNGVFRVLAETRLAALRTPADPADGTGTGVGSPGAPATGPLASVSGTAVVGADAPRWQPGAVFRDCAVCPEMVVMRGGGVALGRYEVTVREYRAFASATGGAAGGGCLAIAGPGGSSWLNPAYQQTDRHPVMCLSWNDVQEYVSWLSRRTGAGYRLPTEEEWERAAAGTRAGPGAGCGGRPPRGAEATCPVGSYGSNGAGLSDMVGNLFEWTADCWEGACDRRVVRGGAWSTDAESLSPDERGGIPRHYRVSDIGFRVARTLDQLSR